MVNALRRAHLDEVSADNLEDLVALQPQIGLTSVQQIEQRGLELLVRYQSVELADVVLTEQAERVNE